MRDAEDHADPLQSDPYVNTERAPLSAWHTLSSFERAASWRLLLQLDSDPDSGVLYGDGGVLAFMIRENDLAAGRFERAWVEWQSH